MSSVAETGASLHRATRVRRGRSLHGTVGGIPRAPGARASRTSTRSTSTAHRRRHLRDRGRRAGRGELAAVRDRPPARRFTAAPCKRALLLPGRARRPRLHPLGAAHGPGAPQRRARDDLPDAQGGRQRRLQGRPAPLGTLHRCCRRLVGRGRLPEVRADDQLHGRADARPGVRDFPPRWARSAGARTSPPRRGSGSSGCCGCGTTGRARSTTRWGSATETPHDLGDHDIWRLPQADDTTAATTRCTATSATARCSAPVRLARRSAPTWPGATPPPSACASRYSAAPTGAWRRAACARREDIFALANTIPSGHLLTVIPFDFYPESEWRDDLEFGATELDSRCARRRAARRVSAHDARSSTCAAAHWAHAYIPPAARRADTLNLYDVSGLAHYELYRAIARVRRSAGPGGHARARCWPTCEGSSTARGRAGRSDPFGFGFPWDTLTPLRTASGCR